MHLPSGLEAEAAKNPYLTPEAEAAIDEMDKVGPTTPAEAPELEIVDPEVLAEEAVADDGDELAALKAELAALRSQLAATEAPAPAPDPDPVADDEYPKVFYNPKIINEQFMVLGSPYRKRFVRGRFVATNRNDEVSVRGCLAGHGRDKADRWCGEDRGKAWSCSKCDFTTLLDAAKYDHELYHDH